MALSEVTQPGGQPETHPVDLVLPSPGPPSLNQASPGLGCPLVFLLYTSHSSACTSSSLSPQAVQCGHTGWGEKRRDGWKRLLIGLDLHCPIGQPLPIGSYWNEN